MSISDYIGSEYESLELCSPRDAAVLDFPAQVCRRWRAMRAGNQAVLRPTKPKLHLLHSSLPALRSLDLSGGPIMFRSEGLHTKMYPEEEAMQCLTFML